MTRKAEIKDLPILAELACQLWSDHMVEEMHSEFAEMIAKPDASFFLAYADETVVGFAQCQLRHDYGTTLHYAPCGVAGDAFKLVVVLPKGINLPLPAEPDRTGEGKLA